MCVCVWVAGVGAGPWACRVREGCGRTVSEDARVPAGFAECMCAHVGSSGVGRFVCLVRVCVRVRARLRARARFVAKGVLSFCLRARLRR